MPGPIYSWQNSLTLDPAEPSFLGLLLDQTQSRIDNLTNFIGVAVDRSDYMDIYSLTEDDGVSWVVVDEASAPGGQAARSLRVSFQQATAALHALLHGGAQAHGGQQGHADGGGGGLAAAGEGKGKEDVTDQAASSSDSDAKRSNSDNSDNGNSGMSADPSGIEAAAGNGGSSTRVGTGQPSGSSRGTGLGGQYVLWLNTWGNSRLDMGRHYDGYFSEGPLLNPLGFLAVRRPAVLWTYDAAALNKTAAADEYFRSHMLVGVWPMAPFPLNDHAIGPDETAERHYRRWGPLFNAMRGRDWYLAPRPAEVYPPGAAGVNAFVMPDGTYLFPIMSMDQYWPHINDSSSTGSSTGSSTARVRSGTSVSAGWRGYGRYGRRLRVDEAVGARVAAQRTAASESAGRWGRSSSRYQQGSSSRVKARGSKTWGKGSVSVVLQNLVAPVVLPAPGSIPPAEAHQAVLQRDRLVLEGRYVPLTDMQCRVAHPRARAGGVAVWKWVQVEADPGASTASVQVDLKKHGGVLLRCALPGSAVYADWVAERGAQAGSSRRSSQGVDALSLLSK
eukprot:CAMPEP_0202914348 /NCGR_PEP_ID=MMETSP1392-20130828/62873_1 /ASSEMBLY_ACC=CAM_ASM_000868 /TAXON_ID=225041 /ORGANISM="Chlamydomonas chlamydogama, Strain SAG 11-48b" /LENGTH=559 /DNA_ID=CAMNT_0049605963 /DNA_START=15 /DNA_END=1694 /DNA_ORIENTATION=-